MYRSVVNKNGTIEVNGNNFRFSQPADEYKTEDVQQIEATYSDKLEYIADDPHYITAQDIEYRNDQVTFEYDLTDLKMFDYLRQLFFHEKLYYYQSLIEIAKRDEMNDVSVLWHKDNFVVDPSDKKIKALIIEHGNFEIQEKKDAFTALKELIIISLTTMNRVLGKPRRADFIEDREEVIHFAEKVFLKAKSVEAIEEYVNAEILHMEMMKKQEQEQQQKQGKLTAFGSKFKANLSGKKNKENERTAMVSKLKQEPEGSPENNKKKSTSNSKLLLGVGGAILGAVLLSFVLTNATDDQAAANEEKEEQINQQEDVLSAYRLYLSGSDDALEQAYAKMEQLDYDKLSEEDQEVMIQWYLEQSKFNEAIKTDTSAAYAVGDYLIEQDDSLESLSEVVNNVGQIDVLSFDIASLEDEPQTMIENQNIKYNERRAEALVNAYVSTEQISELEFFMEQIKDKDAQSYENLLKYYYQVDTSNNNNDNNNDNGNNDNNNDD